MNEPPKTKLGCNLLFIGVLQPNCRIMLEYRSIFDCSLGRCYAGDGHAIG